MGTDRQTDLEERRSAMRQALGALSAIVPVGVVGVGSEGDSWFHNQRWEDICGRTGVSMRGLPWYEAVHPDDVAAVAAAWRTQAEHRGKIGRFRVVDGAGTVRECKADAIAMVDQDQALSGYLIVVVDAEHDSSAPALSSAQFLDAVLDQSDDFVTILNPDGSWRWSSGGARRLMGHQGGYDPTEGFLPFVHPDDLEQATETVARIVAGELAPEDRFEFRVRTADGSWRDLEGIVDVLTDVPAVRGIVIHARDITDRKRQAAELEATGRRLAELINSMKAAVVLQDSEDRVVHANQAFVEMWRLERTPEELRGMTLAAAGLSSESIVDPAGFAEVALGIRSRGERSDNVRVTMVDGRVLEIDFIPFLTGESYQGRLSVLRDVTDRARAEEERERLLASEREENRRLAELDALKSEFFAVVSHELRTPLTSIVGYTQLLRSVVHEREGVEEVEYLDAITRNVERLLRLAGDLVVLDSLETGTLPIRISSVEVTALVEDVARTIGPHATSGRVRVEIDVHPGPTLEADRDRLEQLLENLTSNAVKFTPPGGLVLIRAWSSDAGWCIEVADTGIGVPEDELGLLQERFFRGSNALRRGLPGSGLGLAVAQAIVDLHGGTMTVASTLGSGTTVSVMLPWQGPAVAESATPGAA